MLLAATACAASVLTAQPVNAQQALSEIIVTARKRQESILNVPVVETVVAAQRLERLHATEMGDLPKLVPGLGIGRGAIAIGSLVSLRGIGSSALTPSVDQSVSLNIDGLSLGQGLAFQSGLFDLGQVEVLKGPQALFYGKSSPAGVISLRTADPTSETEVIARGAFDFKALTRRVELILSGPVSDTLKLRLSTMYSASDGYFHNVAIPGGFGALTPQNDRAPRTSDYMVRGTALWAPTERFDARLKVNLVHSRAENGDLFQLTSCPYGTAAPVPVIGGGEDCKMDRNMRIVDLDPRAFLGVLNNGVPVTDNYQRYGTLELNYKLNPALSLSSTTAYYKLRHKSLFNTTETAFAGPGVAFENRFKRREFTEELRLNSDFEGPVNVTVGAFYQDAAFTDRVTGRANQTYAIFIPPALLNSDADTTVNIRTHSVFGQLRWMIVPRVELSGGARWTDEKRTEVIYNMITGTPVLFPVNPSEIHSRNVAPEVTLTYRPTDDLTLFGSYKEGFKSGSFAVGPLPTTPNNSFGDEEVKGWEVGLKTRLLDRTLLANLAAYDYRYKGLQVGAVDPAQNGRFSTGTQNAGSARTYGVDFDAAWRPGSVDGLGLNASVNWNHGRYNVLNTIPCYSGQTFAMGCTQFARGATSGPFVAQDLSGTPLIRAPEWAATLGFDYERPFGDGMTVVFAGNSIYSSRYVTVLAAGRPNSDNYQKATIKFDLSVALRSKDEQWEVALIGKNITDRLTSGNCAASNYAGGSIFPVNHPAEVGCFVDPGREVWVRLTYRPLAGR